MSECLYCTQNDFLKSIMIFVCKVDGCDLYLNRNQTHKGRCILAYKKHKRMLAELTGEEAAEYFAAVTKTARVLTKVFEPQQLNLGMFGDESPHLHCHFVPKNKGCVDFGGTFQLQHQPPVYLSEDEYAEMIERIKKGFEDAAV